MALSNFTKCCACHAKWISWLILDTNETLFTMRGATCVIVQTHQILRLPRKMTVPNLKEICWKRMKRHFQCAADPTMIRAWSDHDPTMKPSVRNPPRNRGYLSRPPRAFCIEKYNISRSGYHSKFHRILRLPRKVTLELHQILRLPRKMNLMIDPWHKWNVIYNARSNMRHSPNSPNTMTVPNLKEICWKRMKRHFLCAADPTMIRPWNRQSATRLATEVTFHAHHEHFVLKNTTFRAPAIIPNFTEYCACHEKWHSNFTKYCACHAKWISWLILDTNETLFSMRGATCVIVQTHQILRLPRKMTVPNLKEICWKRMKRHFQCAADPSMIRPWSDHGTVSPQPASQPRLPFTPTTSILYWKIQHFALRLSFQILPNTAPATKSDTWTSPNTAPATKSDTCTSPNTAPATKSDTWTSANKAITWLSYDFTELLLDWAMKSDTWTSANKAITWLSYDFTELLLDWAMTWLSYYLTELCLDWPITWRHLLLDDTFHLTPTTWRHLLLDDITWRHLLLDDTFHLTPTTWRHLLLDDITWRHLHWTTLLDDTYFLTTHYLTTLLDDTYYLTTPITWRHLLLDDITWRHLILDDTYYLTTWLDDTYYLPTPTTWRHLLLDDTLLDDITWRHLLLDDITWRHLLLDDTLLDDITWRHLLLDDTYFLTTHYLTTLLDDTYYLTTLLDDTYYLTTPITWRHLLLDDTLLDDTYYLTTHYLTTPTTWRHITWRHLLLDDITWRHLLLDDITWRHLLLDNAISFVYRKFLNLNFLRWIMKKQCKMNLKGHTIVINGDFLYASCRTDLTCMFVPQAGIRQGEDRQMNWFSASVIWSLSKHSNCQALFHVRRTWNAWKSSIGRHCCRRETDGVVCETGSNLELVEIPGFFSTLFNK